MNGMDHIDRKHDGLPVLFWVCPIGIYNELVAGGAFRDLNSHIIREGVQPFDAFPCVQSQRTAIFLSGIEGFKNRFGQNLAADQFLQTDLVSDIVRVGLV